VSVKSLFVVPGLSETLLNQYRDRDYRAHYAPFDLALAALEVIVTAHVAFAACVVLGGVLLQTAPPMMTSPGLNKGPFMGGILHFPVGMSGPAGRMEGFWRVVREVCELLYSAGRLNQNVLDRAS